MRWQKWSRLLALSLLVHALVFSVVEEGGAPPRARLQPLEASAVVAARILPPRITEVERQAGQPRDLRVMPAASAAGHVSPIRGGPNQRQRMALPAAGGDSGEWAGAVVRRDADESGFPAPDDELLYRLRLARVARSFKTYPAIALSRAWEGTVELQLEMKVGAARPDITLRRSSGHEALDQEAQALLTKATEQTPLPEGLRGRSFSLAVPIAYYLPGN